MIKDLSQKKIIIRPNGTKRVQTINDEPSRCQTQFADASDVNNIVKSYQKNPDPSIFRSAGVFADTTLLGDYQYSLDLVVQANQAFDSLPSKIRDHFKNDPSKLFAFMQDPNNYDEGVKLGIVDPKKPTQNQNANQNSNQNANPNQNQKKDPPNDAISSSSKKTDTE